MPCSLSYALKSMDAGTVLAAGRTARTRRPADTHRAYSSRPRLPARNDGFAPRTMNGRHGYLAPDPEPDTPAADTAPASHLPDPQCAASDPHSSPCPGTVRGLRRAGEICRVTAGAAAAPGAEPARNRSPGALAQARQQACHGQSAAHHREHGWDAPAAGPAEVRRRGSSRSDQDGSGHPGHPGWAGRCGRLLATSSWQRPMHAALVAH